ncbi:MAG: efflux RND transporter periplasmic adaptor subunit [Pseudomonadota bacterium]|nr:efflux RND transporter periplasmic adaptor subunit [Pseudomonadota bacterium]
MDFRNKLGPMLAISMAGLAAIWLLSGENGITQAQAQDTSSNETKPSVSSTNKPASLFKVTAVHSTSESIPQTIKLSGYTSANNTLSITNQLPGYVASVHVSKGDRVNAEHVLIEVDRRALEANVVHAQALVKQRALELEGIRKLTGQKLTSEVSVASAEAALASAKANLITLKIDLENSSVRAPFTGVINDFSIKPGQWLNDGATVATLIDLNPLKVAAQLPQKYLNKLSINSAVELTINGQETKQGKVSYISMTADNATRAIPFEVSIDNSDAKLSAGLSAEINLILGQVEAHPVSPALLNVNNDGQMSVKTLEGDIVTDSPVQVVKTDREFAWVSGLATKSTIITSGQGFVKAGDQVEVTIEPAQQTEGTSL